MHVPSLPDSVSPTLRVRPRSDAFDLVSALDTYALCATRLVETWFDMDVYARLGRQIDAIRAHGMAHGGMTVLSLQLVIAHTELLSTMWQHASVGVSAARIEEVQMRHAFAVEALRIAAAGPARGERLADSSVGSDR